MATCKAALGLVRSGWQGPAADGPPRARTLLFSSGPSTHQLPRDWLAVGWCVGACGCSRAGGRMTESGAPVAGSHPVALGGISLGASREGVLSAGEHVCCVVCVVAYRRWGVRPPVWFVAWSRSTLGVSLVGGRVVMRGSPHACVGWGCACPSSPRIPLQLEVWASWASHGPQWG